MEIGQAGAELLHADEPRHTPHTHTNHTHTPHNTRSHTTHTNTPVHTHMHTHKHHTHHTPHARTQAHTPTHTTDTTHTTHTHTETHARVHTYKHHTHTPYTPHTARTHAHTHARTRTTHTTPHTHPPHTHTHYTHNEASSYFSQFRDTPNKRVWQCLVVPVTLPTATPATGYHDRKDDSKVGNSIRELKYKVYWNEHCVYVLNKVGDISFVRTREILRRYGFVISVSRNTPILSASLSYASFSATPCTGCHCAPVAGCH
jgi:hypothetical protein